jgi:hypothetical protein
MLCGEGGTIMKSIHVLGLTLALAGLLLAAAPATAQEVAWDQSQVSKLVDELIAAIGQIQVTGRSQVTPEVQEELRPALKDLAELKKEVRILSQQLRGGKGRVETWPRANRCGVVLARVRSHGSDEPLVAENEEHVARAEALIAQIRTFYGKEPAVATPPTETTD